jgi:hypothetical protein
MTTREIDGVENVRTATEAVSDFYIETQTSLIERPLRTLKHGDIFAVLDRYGDIGVGSHGPEGIFLRDTRYLSGFDLRFEGQRPVLLLAVCQFKQSRYSSRRRPDNTTRYHRHGTHQIAFPGRML